MQVEQQRDFNEDMQSKHHRDVHRDTQVTKSKDVHGKAQDRRSFVDLVHREVQMQLTKFLNVGNIDSSVMWQPYVVSYYAELATLCLRDSLPCGEDFVPLLTQCLSSPIYDIRLASLRFLAGNNGDKMANADYDDDMNDDVDDDGDNFYPSDALSQSAAERREQLSKVLLDGDSSLLRLLIDMLLYKEKHDECLLMVSTT